MWKYFAGEKMKNIALKILIVVTEAIAIFLIPFSFFEGETFKIMGAVGYCFLCVGGVLILVTAFLEIWKKHREHTEKPSDDQK